MQIFAYIYKLNNISDPYSYKLVYAPAMQCREITDRYDYTSTPAY